MFFRSSSHVGYLFFSVQKSRVIGLYFFLVTKVSIDIRAAMHSHAPPHPPTGLLRAAVNHRKWAQINQTSTGSRAENLDKINRLGMPKGMPVGDCDG